jgi:fumarate hydratase subunit alpha
MCIEANYKLASDVEERVRGAFETETAILGKQILGQLAQNLDIAANDSIPICQDTGMAIIFVRLGQEVHIEGGNFEDAINEGIRQGYREG